jgi:hypothetical protein
VVPDGCLLLVAVGSGEKDAGLRTGRSHDDPPLGTIIVRKDWRVLGKFEAERVNEEGGRGVVVVDDDRHQLQEHRCTVGGVPDRRLRESG